MKHYNYWANEKLAKNTYLFYRFHFYLKGGGDKKAKYGLHQQLRARCHDLIICKLGDDLINIKAVFPEKKLCPPNPASFRDYD